MDLGGILAQPRVQFQNVRGGTLFTLLPGGVIADRHHRTKNRLDTVRAGQLRHRLNVLLDHGERLRPGIAGDVVGAGQQNECRGLQIDHVRKHPNQHLRSGLPANAAIHVRLAGERLRQLPDVCNGVAEEHHALRLRRLRLQRFIGGVIAAKLVPILELIGESLRRRGQAAVCPGGPVFFHQLAPDGAGHQKTREEQTKRDSVHGCSP